MNKKIQQLRRKYELIEELTDFESKEDYEDIDDFFYAEFYLIKKFSLKYGFNIEKIKNSITPEEYEKNVKDELEKIPYKSVLSDKWFWPRLYNAKEEVFDFIKSIDINDFDIHIPSYPWVDDSIISKYIDYSKIYYVLSVFNTFYDEKISKCCSIDVIYHTFQSGNIDSHKARLELVDCIQNYNFICGNYPKETGKQYDLVVFNLETTSLETIDRTSIIDIDENGGKFVGDDVLANISNTCAKYGGYLTPDGIALFKVPFTFVSKLTDEIIDDNIIDKIIFLPKEKELFYEDYIEVKDVYVIVKKNKTSTGIEFIDEQSGEKYFVENELIKKHKGCTNMHIYNKHNPSLEKLYKIKEDNSKQLDIISKSSRLIDKQIDELDFE